MAAGALLSVAGFELAGRHRQLSEAIALFGHLRWWAVALAVVAEAGSLMAFARLQRWLLAAGSVRIGLGQMVELVVAGNALGTSLPGGAGWSAGWAWSQLRRRGAPRATVIWVLLAAGFLSSFALFIVIAVGILVAGRHGPLASTRPAVVALASIPVAVAALAEAMHRSVMVDRLAGRLAERVQSAFPPTRRLASAYRAILEIQPRPVEWVGMGGLALLNWLDNCVCLVASVWALRGPVPWRGVLVAYGFAQVAASLPITPGGLGVVEGSLTALLVAYGMRTNQALATVALYRLVSFWGPVAVGWSVWAALMAAQRGLGRPHPWRGRTG